MNLCDYFEFVDISPRFQATTEFILRARLLDPNPGHISEKPTSGPSAFCGSTSEWPVIRGSDPARFSEAEFSLRISRYNDSDYRRLAAHGVRENGAIDWRDPLVPSADVDI